VLRDLVTCTGAATCKLGICLSRGLAKGIADALSRRPTNLGALGEIQVNISGCPNSCSRHPIAHIGLQGAARRVDGRLVPHYTVLLGGRVEEGKTALAIARHTLPAQRVPAFLADLLEAFAHSELRPDFHAFLRTADDLIDELAAKHKSVPSFSEDKNFYYDWGADEPFSLAGRGPGECGAGVFDLIEVDLRSASEALAEKRWFAAAALAARALLVTRGEQAGNDRDAFLLFQKHFVDAGLVDARFRTLVDCGGQAAGADNSAAKFAAEPDLGPEVTAFVSTIQTLFKSMDATLQFPKRAEPVVLATSASSATPVAPEPIDAEKDFRGVVCPLNYVKTKMALDRLKPGQTLAVLLDADGARNVPESAAKDGHTIVSVMPEGGCSRVIIRKRSTR